jgi:hypothetical protein
MLAAPRCHLPRDAILGLFWASDRWYKVGIIAFTTFESPESFVRFLKEEHPMSPILRTP